MRSYHCGCVYDATEEVVYCLLSSVGVKAFGAKSAPGKPGGGGGGSSAGCRESAMEERLEAADAGLGGEAARGR